VIKPSIFNWVHLASLHFACLAATVEHSELERLDEVQQIHLKNFFGLLKRYILHSFGRAQYIRNDYC
jgi:hypothetical protein